MGVVRWWFGNAKLDQDKYRSVTCPACAGSGEERFGAMTLQKLGGTHVVAKERCSRCGGSGSVKERIPGAKGSSCLFKIVRPIVFVLVLLIGFGLFFAFCTSSSSDGDGSDETTALLWEGTYQCDDGPLGARLSLDLEAGEVEGQATVEGSITYFPAAPPSLEDVPIGATGLTGTLADGQLALRSTDEASEPFDVRTAIGPYDFFDPQRLELLADADGCSSLDLTLVP